MRNDLPTATRRWRLLAALAAAVLLGGCGAGAPGTSVPSTGGTTGPATAGPATPSPTATPIPDPRSLPLIETPTGYRRAETVPFGFGLVVDGYMVATNYDTAELRRWDASTHEPVESLHLGDPKAFPPDLQSAWPGAGGLWVTLASQHAVVLLDVQTGRELRRVEIPGSPYDLVEAGTDLWIADFERSAVTRYDLAADRVVATIPISVPTDVLFGEGSIWVAVHMGRGSDAEPVDARGGQVARIDPATNKIVERVWAGHRPYFLATGFGAIWTGNATSANVTRVDAATNLTTNLPIGEDGAFDIEVVGDSVWAIVGPQWPREQPRACDPATSFFVRIDPVTSAVRERVAFPCAGGITPVGDAFWVSGRGPEGDLSVLFAPDR